MKNFPQITYLPGPFGLAGLGPARHVKVLSEARFFTFRHLT